MRQTLSTALVAAAATTTLVATAYAIWLERDTQRLIGEATDHLVREIETYLQETP